MIFKKKDYGIIIWNQIWFVVEKKKIDSSINRLIQILFFFRIFFSKFTIHFKNKINKFFHFDCIFFKMKTMKKKFNNKRFDLEKKILTKIDMDILCTIRHMHTHTHTYAKKLERPISFSFFLFFLFPSLHLSDNNKSF